MTSLFTDINTPSQKKLLLAVLTRKYKPHHAWGRPSFYCKFLLRCLWYPYASYDYLVKLSQLDDLPHILAIQGMLPAKVHRPYLMSGLNARQRSRTILSHYQLVSQVDNPVLRSILSCKSLQQPLLSWQSKDGDEFTLSCASGMFDREGELTLSLHFRGILLTTLSFGLCNYQKKPTLFIAGLQGAAKHLDQQIVRDATKACSGLFPKRLLVEAALLIAKACHITQICAVGDKSHVFMGPLRYRLSKRKVFLASYSEFWQTLGATEDDKAIFHLPLEQARKPLEEVASKKRAEYRRRYQLLDEIQVQFNDRLRVEAN